MKESKFHTDILLRFIDGTLEPREEQELRAELGRSEQLRHELAQLENVQNLLRESTLESSQTTLRPFFTDRVMRKLHPADSTEHAVDEISYFLLRLFRPVAIAGLFLAVCLAVYNLNLSNGFTSDTSTAEAILALPPVNSLSIYDLDLYTVDSSTGQTLIPF